MSTSRREFIRVVGASVGAAGLSAAARGAGAAATPPSTTVTAPALTVGLPRNWRGLRKIDAHNHVFGAVHRPNADWSDVEAMLEAAESLGIEKLCCSRPITAGVLADIGAVREANDSILAAMRRYPRQIAGYCFVQPGTGAAALDEIERCLDAGMIGVKLYNQFKYTDPVVFPIAERCVARKIIFLGHSGHVTDVRTQQAQPRISDAADFAELSRRYPELALILGHLNGGGDWEWTIRALRECPNVHVDTSGSVLEADTIGRAVREIGHRRLLFATDMVMEGGVGKVLSAVLTNEQREDVFWRNMQRLLERRRA